MDNKYIHMELPKKKNLKKDGAPYTGVFLITAGCKDTRRRTGFADEEAGLIV